MYASFANVQALGFELDATEQTKFDQLLLPAASRLIDRACEVADGFFEIAGAEASERTYYGDGTDYLLLPPFVGGSIAEVALPDGYEALEASDYFEATDARNFYLVRQYGTTRLSLTDAQSWFAQGVLPVWPVGPFSLTVNSFRTLARGGAGWSKGVAVTVTARWGWEAVPAEIAAATVEVALHLWRNADPVWMRQANVPITPAALPATAQMVADKYRERRAPVFA